MNDDLKNKIKALKSAEGKERDEFLSLFHRSELEYDLKKELYLDLDNTPEFIAGQQDSKTGFDRLWKRIEIVKARTTTRAFRLGAIYWAAATLVLGFLVGSLVNYDRKLTPETEFYTAIAPSGSVSEMILPDGTVIFLNAGSEIKYASNLNSNMREVYLKGEAWFNVKESQKIPFIVHTSYYDVRVMGTEFNVKAYEQDDEVITTLEKGSIEVISTEKLKITNNVILSPGEQLVFNKTQKTLVVSDVRAPIFSSWKENKLIFINMKFGELVILLERKYGVEILVKDSSILNYHYDGTIKNETIIEVLNILKNTLPVNYSINNQEVVIYKK